MSIRIGIIICWRRLSTIISSLGCWITIVPGLSWTTTIILCGIICCIIPMCRIKSFICWIWSFVRLNTGSISRIMTSLIVCWIIICCLVHSTIRWYSRVSNIALTYVIIIHHFFNLFLNNLCESFILWHQIPLNKFINVNIFEFWSYLHINVAFSVTNDDIG